MRTSGVVCRAALLTAFALGLCHSSVAQSSYPRKLSGTFTATHGDVASYQVSANGSLVVYLGDQDADGVSELYSVPIAGGTPVKLNGTLAGGGNVSDFLISADSTRVVYRADQSTDNVPELYSVAIAGGTPVKLNGTLVSGGNVLSGYLISADSTRVVYRADQATDEVYELYSVPIAGGTPVNLNGTLAFGGDVQSGYLISADSGSVIFRANKDRNGVDLYAWRSQAVWISGGGDWPEALNWRNSVEPDATVEAVIAVPALVHVPAAATPAAANALVLGGGGGLSVVELADGAVLTLPLGAQMSAGAVLRGDGLVAMGATPLRIPAGAELRAGHGDRFAVQSGDVANAGRIEAFGTAYEPAEIEFYGVVSNQASTGVVAAHHAILQFSQGLVNCGSLSLLNGINDVIGDVANGSGGLITVSGGAMAIFYEDVVNDGVINVSAAGGTRSSAVFCGAMSGAGVSGGGDVFIEGDARPGFSPAVMAFGGDVSFGPLASLEIEVGGTAPGTQYDRLSVAGHLSLDGALNVSLISGFIPEAGMTFDLWDAGSVEGQFTAVYLPALPPGLFWHTGEIDSTGILSVGLTPETYVDYASYYGLTGDPAGDDDGDRQPNMIEYVMGSNPRVSDLSASGLELWHEDTDAHVRFPVAQPLGSDVVLDLQAATTLLGGGDWATIATRTGNGPWSASVTIEQTASGAGLAQVEAIEPVAGFPYRFYRYRVRLTH